MIQSAGRHAAKVAGGLVSGAEGGSGITLARGSTGPDDREGYAEAQRAFLIVQISPHAA